ncbi:hypothetical protein D8B20_16200 [Candidatus Pantoea soli]|uniref:Uncharacterized protein n=1 Tax=Candidatus Pantoea soli TaxID=3098669 RepID=A0A518XGJ2_9GAMM|nr:hypothetical protein D8B20_16200 [Pantoea soli]
MGWIIGHYFGPLAKKIWLDNERYSNRWMENFICLALSGRLFHRFMKCLTKSRGGAPVTVF